MEDHDKDDLHVTSKNKAKYHSLLGRYQHPLRNEKTIKMSSGSATVNIYKNVETRDIITAVSK